MFLKQLEIHGFKSFGDRTKLEFGRGITAIVGPNGSGKSNIADGIRWVLGEQSARTLRGDTMQDVIFAGSDGKGPLGMASVSLTLSDCRGSLGLDFDEITVARRVYRSGESQYLINKSPCRLRDIHDLFRDTGLGREGYSLIGQGQIDAILLARPGERRLIIEEAAGIGKYRARKAEAAKKLADTEGKLLRLEDIIGELERQLEPLAKAAARAKTYLALSQEYQVKGQAVCAYGWAELQESAHRFSQRHSELTASLIEVNDAQGQEDAAVAILRQEIADLEERLEYLQEIRDASVEERAEIQRRQDRAEERLQYVEVEAHRLLDQETDGLGRRQTIRQDLARCLWQLRSLRRVWNQELQKIAGLMETQEERHQERQTLLAQLETINSAKELVRQKVATAQADLQASQSRESLWQDQTLVLSRRLEEITRQLQGLSASVSRKAAAVSENRREQVSMQQSLSSIEIMADDAKARWLKQLEVVRSWEEKLQMESSRLRALSAMEKDYVGYHRGVKAVLQNRERFPGICGVVAELIEVPKELEVAIEIALGGGLQNIVTDTDVGPRQAVSYLKERKAGRATFLPLDGLKVSPFPKGDLALLQQENVIGLASQLIRYEPRYQRLVEYLLGRVIVTKDLDTAVALSKELRGANRIVTLDGDTVSAGGAITGGSLPMGEKSGLLQRRQQVSRSAKAVQSIKDTLAKERQTAAAKEVKLQKIDLETKSLRDDLHQRELEIRDQEQEIGLGKSEITRWEREKAQIETEMAGLETKIESEAKEQSQDMLSIDHLTADEAAWQAQVLAVQDQLDILDDDQARTQESFTTHKVGVATRESQIQAAEQEIKRHRHLLSELTQLLAGLEESRAAVEQDELQFRQKMEESATELRQLEGKLHDIEDELRESNRLRKDKQSHVAVKEQTSRARQQAKEKLQHDLSFVQRELDKIISQKARLIETMENEYRLQPETLAHQSVPTGDIGQMRAEVHTLKKRLQDLGPTSIGTIDEYAVVQERYGFLKEQQGDLVEAREQLNVVIEEMDEISSARFAETFRRVQQEFQAIFVKLFGGGTAELMLTPAPHQEDGGLEIAVRPPGKRLQNISLLSGGERALTAISLLFALLRVKPSPFCVLDEIDAALDESNLQRFTGLLQDFSEDTQFIVITHRPGSMEVADTLYGVTMNKANISQLVSVQLDDVAASLEE